MGWKARRGAALALALVLTVIAGCTERRDRDGASTYTYSWYVPAAVGGAGLALAAVGGLLMGPRRGEPRSRLSGKGFGLVLMGAALAGLMTPGLATDYATVDGDHFEGRSGAVWLVAKSYDIRFDQLVSIGHSDRVTRRRRGRTDHNHTMDCTLKGGGVVRIDLAGPSREAHPAILDRARAHGVPVDENEVRR